MEHINAIVHKNNNSCIFFTYLSDFKYVGPKHLTNYFPFSSCNWNIWLGIVNAEATTVKMYKQFLCRAQWFSRVQILAVAGFLFFILGSANAAIWYVDSVAAGANNGTSWANAWTALSQVAGVAAGDTVYISGGPSGSSQTYVLSGSWTPVGGTSASPVTYQIGQDSPHKGTVVFSGSGSFLNPVSNVVISGDAGDGQRHFSTSGFVTVMYTQSAVSNLRIAYVNFGQLAGNTGVNGDVMYLAPVKKFEFDHNYVYCSSPGCNAFAYYVFNGTTWDDSKIHDNIIYLPRSGSGLGADCFESGGSTGFSIYNNAIICYSASYTGSQHADGWQDTGGSSYIKIYGNTFVNFANYAVYGDAYYGGFTHLWIYNNIAILSDANLQASAAPGGIVIGANPGQVSQEIFNDVIVANNICDDYAGHQCFVLNNVTTESTIFTNCIIVNNIAVNSGGINLQIQGNNTTPTLDNVSLTTSQAQQNFVSYTANTDVDANGNTLNNYHLLSTASTLIGQGANEYAYFTTDRAGNPRPATGAWDIGVYAYGSVNVNNTNPVITVSATSLDFGTLLANTSTNLTLTVQNTGGGTLTGSASVPAPFQIVSGGSYSLGSNQTQTVTIGFNPTTAGTFNQTVTFTGGNGASAGLTGIAVALQSGLSFGASAGSIVSPFTVTSMTPITINGLTVSSYISQANATGLSGSGEAIYGFTLLSAGNYVVSTIVNAPSTSANSFYVNIDGQPTDPTMIWDPPVTSGFTNLLVSWRGTGTDTNNQFIPQVFNLTAGPHQLIVRGREAGSLLAGITIAPYAAVPPAPTGLHIIGP